jgi:glycosyltransferase involved in cell wall biosynthesis
MVKNMAELPLVSVIMTTLNSARFIEEAVESIIAQTYRHWEMIIVDGGSTDETIPIIQKYTDPRIRLFECKGLRRSAQLNYAIRKAFGEIIAIMDSDDIALHERIDLQLQYLRSHDDVSIVGSWAEYVDEKGGFLAINRRPIEHEEIIKNLFSFGQPSLSSIMFKKQTIIENSQYFNESLQGLEDIEWYLRVSSLVKFAVIPKVLMKFRQTKNSLSRVKNTANEKIFIDCVNAYYSQIPKDGNSQTSKPLLGIAHYYYGVTGTARKLLLQSLLKDGVSLQILRYLIPAVLFPGALLNALRGNSIIRDIVNGCRQLKKY